MTAPTEEIQETQIETPNILRTRRDGVWEVYNGPWGSYLRVTDDPEANVEITEEHLKKFELKNDIHRIPADLWARWVKLCFYYVDKVSNSVEVSIRILRNEEDPSKYRFLVPRQKVSGASVRVETFDEAIDIETGEELTQYPPAGWIPVGSSHSHNTMQAFFSGVDDKYELDDPGIHLVVGSIDTKNMKYTIASSVVGSRRRFMVDFDKLIDATPVSGVEFHPKVIDYVDYSTPSVSKGTFTSYPTSKWTRKETKTNTTNLKSNFENMEYWGWDGYDDDKSDPFYWNSTYIDDGTDSKLKLWNVMDVLNDYVKHHDSPQSLFALRNDLQDFISDLEILLEDEVETLIETNIY